MTAFADIDIVSHKIQSMWVDCIAFDSRNIAAIVISTLQKRNQATKWQQDGY